MRPRHSQFHLVHDDHAMDNMRARIATRKEKKKQVAEEVNKSLSSKGKASKDLNKVTTDEGGRKLTKLIDRALHDVASETEEMDDAKESDCAALRPIALTLAKVYKGLQALCSSGQEDRAH